MLRAPRSFRFVESNSGVWNFTRSKISAGLGNCLVTKVCSNRIWISAYTKSNVLIAGVEVHLSAASLGLRYFHNMPEAAQKADGRLADIREHAVYQAGHHQGDAHVAARYPAETGDATTCSAKIAAASAHGSLGSRGS